MAKPNKNPEQKSPKKSRPERAAERKVALAYGLLVDRPLSLAMLDPLTRNNTVISAIITDEGKERVLSRYGDMIWELWPYVTTPNTQAGRKRLDWSRIPAAYREVCKAVLYRWWRVGTEGKTPPSVASLCRELHSLTVFCRYLEGARIASMAEIHPIHISNYIQAQKSRKLVVSTLKMLFMTIERLYLFRDQHTQSLPFHPWPESSACEVAGDTGQANKDSKKIGKTPLIPEHVSQALFVHSETILNAADAVLDERDKGLRSAWIDPEVLAIRNACFYQLGVLTGMRSSELSSIEVGAIRIEIKNGYTFYWISSVEHKTKKGQVDYLVCSKGQEILRILERWSEPYRKRLAEQLAAWEAESGERSNERLQQIHAARKNLKKLFLGNGKGGIVPVSGVGWTAILKAFAKDAGVKWVLSPHQMRRLYAFTFAKHRLGGLLFLKEQFKHSSIDMSQLYAANPHQDAALYEEILEAVRELKVETIVGWLHDDELLAGGAGKKIMMMRAQDFPSREALIKETSDKLNLRSNGHAWCLAQDEGCGGSGIFEKRCGSCHNGVIDSNFRSYWEETYRQLAELMANAEEMGPGAAKRVQRDLDEAARVLRDLGVDMAGLRPNQADAQQAGHE